MNKKKIVNLLLISTIFGLASLPMKSTALENSDLVGSASRAISGSNYWRTSNLREWLNSSDRTVKYTCNAPNSKNVGSNAYDEEAGFMNEFTQEELNNIATTNRLVSLAYGDMSVKDIGGSSYPSYPFTYTPSLKFDFASYMNNYNDIAKAYCKDKVFLLTAKEEIELYQNRGWSLMKKGTNYINNKYGYSPAKNISYYMQHPVHNIGSESIQVINDNDNNPLKSVEAKGRCGVSPAMILKQSSSVKRVEEYDSMNLNPTWKHNETIVPVQKLNIGDIIEFGQYKGERIKWRVINKINGFAMIQSEKVIDEKVFDAPGDNSKRYSNIDLENKFPNVDISDDNIKYANVQGSEDTKQASVTINEDKLFKRVDNSFELNFHAEDESGIAYVELPNGNKINVNSPTCDVTYNITSNGYFNFGVMDKKGNYRPYIVPVGNINLKPIVKLTTDYKENDWSNKDINFKIIASNDLGYSNAGYYQSDRDNGGSPYWDNYTTFAGKRIRFTGDVTYVSSKEGFDLSNILYYPMFSYKYISKTGDEYTVATTWPGSASESLGALKNSGKTRHIDTIYTIPNTYFSNFCTATHVGVNVNDYGKFTIKWDDVKYELLDKDDFAISKIVLPDGSEVNSNQFSGKMNEEGEHTYTYKVYDNKGTVVEKSLTVKIDKSSPTLKVSGNPVNWVNDDVVLHLNIRDDVSGIKEVILPNGKELGNGRKDMNIDFRATQNGSYTFKVIDQANNVTTQTINIDKIDKTKPTLNYDISINQNKKEGMLNLEANDDLSGVKEIELPDEQIIQSNKISFKINNNGLYPIKVLDSAGNEFIKIIEVLDLKGTTSGIDKIEYKLSGATNTNWIEYKAPFKITNEGITTITARCYDKAGNISSEQTSTAKIDKTKPINNSITIVLN